MELYLDWISSKWDLLVASSSDKVALCLASSSFLEASTLDFNSFFKETNSVLKSFNKDEISSFLEVQGYDSHGYLSSRY